MNLERYAQHYTGRGLGQVEMVKLKPRGWVNDPNFKRAQHDRMSRNEMTNSDPRMSHYHESSQNPPNRTVSFARGTKSDSVSFSELTMTEKLVKVNLY